jgi:hypothetical protein
MSRSRSLLLWISALSVTPAAWAGTVYVPLPGITTVGASTYEAQVSLGNLAATTREISQFSLAVGTDGTQRGTAQPLVQPVLPGQNVLIKPAAAFRGLLELTGASDTRFAARLARTGLNAGPGTLLPVIGSDSATLGGKAVTLLGLVSADTRTTDVAVTNLGKQAADCTVSFKRTDGTAIGSPATVSLAPLSLRYFQNVFAVLGATGVTDVRGTVVCSRDFHAFALLANSFTGELALVAPSGRGESTLSIPGAAPVCPAGATCFDRSGVVAQPTAAVPATRLTFAPPAGTYRKIRLTMDVDHNGWNSAKPAALHQLFWLVKGTNKNMFGYLSLRGPNSNQMQLWHGIGLSDAKKKKVVRAFQAFPGRTYRIDYTYDAGGGVFSLKVFESGALAIEIGGAPNVGSFAFTAAEALLLDLGFPGTIPDEAASLGWAYRDVHLEMFP